MYARSRFENKTLHIDTLNKLQDMLEELENLFPFHDYLEKIKDMLFDTTGEYTEDNAITLIDDVSEIILINFYQDGK